MDDGTPTPSWVIWLPIVTAIISGVFAFTGGVVAQWMTMGRERKLRARQFQFDTIIELQNRLTELTNRFMIWRADRTITHAYASTDPMTQEAIRILTLSTRLKHELAERLVNDYLLLHGELLRHTMGLVMQALEEESLEALEADKDHEKIIEAHSMAVAALGVALRPLQ